MTSMMTSQSGSPMDEPLADGPARAWPDRDQALTTSTLTGNSTSEWSFTATL